MKKFIDEWSLTILLVTSMIGIGWIALSPYRPVIAAPAIKQQEAGCEVVGKVGNWTVSHCFDGYGHEFIANDAGFIAPLPN